jgi:DNA-3-methyladenine glycosylase II
MRNAIRHLKSADPVMARLIGKIGKFDIRYLEPDFETLARSIVYQQLSGKSAGAIYTRLLDAVPGGRMAPEALLRVSPDQMRALGMSRQKIAYLRDLAERTVRGEVDFSSLGSLTDEEVVAELTRVKGIGLWTAQMYLIFALRRPDVLPVGDLGIRGAIRKAYELAEVPGIAEVERIGERWRPWCSVASWYLWRSVDGDAGW